MKSITFSAQEVSRFVIFATEDTKLSFKTLKSGAKENSFSKMLISKTLETHNVSVVVEDKSIGKKVTTVQMTCPCKSLYHFKANTKDIVPGKELTFKISRVGASCRCGIFFLFCSLIFFKQKHFSS